MQLHCPFMYIVLLFWALSTYLWRSQLLEKSVWWWYWDVSLWILLFSSNSNFSSTLWVIWVRLRLWSKGLQVFVFVFVFTSVWSTLKVLQNCHHCLNGRWAHIVYHLFTICADQHKDNQTWGEKRVRWSLDGLWTVSGFLHSRLMVEVWAAVNAVCWTAVRLRTVQRHPGI